MALKIEKGIEVGTVRKYGRQSELTDALAKMDVGDSVLIKKNAESVSAKVCQWRDYHGRKERFTTRTQEGGVRVWRVK